MVERVKILKWHWMGQVARIIDRKLMKKVLERYKDDWWMKSKEHSR